MSRPPLDSFVGAKPALDSFESAPTSVTTSTPLDVSTKAPQATFPATGDEGVLGIAAKTVGNIPSSALGFAKGAFDFLNPFNTGKTLGTLAASVGQVARQPNARQVAKDTLYGLPREALKAVVPQFIQHIVSGDTRKAAATLENDPVGQILPLIFIARTAANKAGVGPQFDQAVSSIAAPVSGAGSAIGGTAKNIAGGAAKFGSSQLTGLSPQTIEQVMSNPQQFSREAQSTVTRPALAESIGKAIADRQTSLDDTGHGYAGIRTLTEPIQVAPNYLEVLIKDTTGLTVSKGKLSATGSSSIRQPSDVNALQTKLYNTWQPEFTKGYLTPEELLNFRSDLSKMVYNDSGIGKSTDLSNLSSVMRGKINTDLRPQVPGLEAIDKTFAPQITELKQLSQGLVDKEGKLTDIAINRIANATGKGKDPQLARLEELSPGITVKIKILKAVEDIQNSRENKPGTYLRAGALGAGIFTLNPYIIVSAIMSLPEIAIPLMRGLGYSTELTSKILKTLNINEKAGSVAVQLAPSTVIQTQTQESQALPPL